MHKKKMVPLFTCERYMPKNNDINGNAMRALPLCERAFAVIMPLYERAFAVIMLFVEEHLPL